MRGFYSLGGKGREGREGKGVGRRAQRDLKKSSEPVIRATSVKLALQAAAKVELDDMGEFNVYATPKWAPATLLIVRAGLEHCIRRVAEVATHSSKMVQNGAAVTVAESVFPGFPWDG